MKTPVTLSFPQTTYEATMGSEFTAPAATADPTVTGITYSSSNEGVATVHAETGAVTLVAAGTTVITATFAGNDEYNSASASYTLNVARDPNANDGSAEKPYTVAEARAVIDAGTGLTGVYVKGIVSEIVTAYSSQYGNISYNISVDGSTTADQLQAYRGKSYNGDKFTSENNIEVGDQVVIYGDLKKYNSTYELDANNKLISNDHKDVTFSFGDETEFEVALNKGFTAPELIKGEYDGTVVYESSNTNVATVASDGTVTLVGLGETTITASGARTSAYHTPTPASYTLTVVDAVWTVEPQASEGGTVSIDGKVITATPAEGYRFANPAYTVSSGEATVSQEGNIFTVTPASDCTVTINFEKIPEHNVVWSVNGEETMTTALEDAAVEFPAAPEAIEGKTFVGWVAEAIDGEIDEAPTFVTSATMATSDLKYYAVFATADTEGSVTEVTDEITASDLVATGTTYTDFSNVKKTSNAVYAGNSAKNSTGAIQLRSKNSNSGIVSTTSGGKVKSVAIAVESGSNTIDIYGSNTAYTVASDLYATDGNSNQGTKIGSLTETGTVTFDGDYAYVGIRSNSGALYLSSVSITWEGGTPATYSGYCTTVDVPIRISNVEELKAFRDAVNTADKTVTSKNVLLVADLDLSGEENWTPIGNLVAYSGQSFDGVFDGNGHTIKNVTVVDQTPKHAVAGLFGSVVNGTIKNLTVENVNLTSSHYAGGIVAYTSNGPTIENCRVIGGTITSVPEKLGDEYDNGDKVGGIFGYATAGSTINNCTVDGLTIKAYRDMGGIAGYSAGAVTNNTVKNTTIIQSDVNAYKDYEITTYDYIVGRNDGATLENNVYEELNNVLTIDGAVAKVGDKLYRKLQAAVDAAEAGQTIDIVDDFTLTTVTTSPSDKYNVNVNKSVTINGNNHVITSAQGKRAIVLEGEGLDVTIKDLTIKSNKAEACLWIASNLTCTLDNTVLDGTNGKSYNQPLTIGSISNEGRVTLNVTNGSVIKTNDAGTAHYAIIAGHPADITVTDSKLIGWANVYLKPDAAGSTVKIEGSEMKSQGLSGNSNNFSILVTEGGNNTIEVKDTKITSSAKEGTYQSLITLGGEGNVVKLLGETTYETNDKTWGAITHNWGSLMNNKLYLDDTTKAAFAGYLDGSHQETIDPADETGLYPVNYVSEIHYYWAVEGGYDGGYYSFADPFKNGWLADGEFIALQKNITLTEDITCQLASGTSFNFLLGDFTADKNDHSVALNTGVTVQTDKQTNIFSAAEAGYVIVETKTETGYSYTAELAQPIIFHDGGEYEGELTVAIAGEGVKYTLNGGAEQTYSAPFTISETTTVKAWAEKDGVKSDEVEKTFTIVAKQAGAEVPDGYYNIKTNDGKFVNVAGRKTVTLVENAEGKAGTVIRVNADAEGVKVLRSQGVDLPGYAKKAMNYVPEIVQLAVDKLHAEGAGELLGTTGYDKIMDKFNESFDYNLYLKKDGEAYRIYGRTPSMKPVVDFYAENKANVDAKLPELEEFINKAIQKVLEKTNGSGASVLVPFSLQTIWERMDSTLTNPADDEAKFYEEVLSSEANVWNFAYQTAMLYWGNLKNHPRFAEIQDKLGDYSKYIDKVENIRPNFKYYIVPSASGVDFISEGNVAIKDASTAWTMEPVSKFEVEIPETNKVGDKYYTTLYTDFAYTLPEGVKAMKVTSIGESGCYGYAETEEIDAQSIAEQTPILLVSETAGSKALELSKTGSAVTDNLLKGPDYLISEYKIKTPQVESLFDMAKSILGESAYETYLKKYEHLMLKNAGTVGNKYFFGLSKDECKEVDVNVCVLENVAEFGTIFASDKENINANKAFLVSDIYTEIRLMKAGDVNRDGKISIADVTALVNIILGKVTEENNPDNFDFGAADVNCDTKRTIADVTALVNIILGKPNN